ncbi:MAG: hypothetical protein P8176_12605 [Gammaproteobacteria bacterium]
MSTVDTTYTGNAYTPTPSETNPVNDKKTESEPKPNDSETVSVEFHLNPQHKKLLSQLFLYLSNDSNCCNHPAADHTPAQTKALTSQENDPKQSSDALRILLENKDVFSQLDSAQSPDKTSDGMVSWEDIHHVLDHPEEYSGATVAAAQALSQNFDAIKPEGGLISHQEIVDFQKNLAAVTGSTPAAPMEIIINSNIADLDIKKGCESLRAVLENSDLFGQLESANPEASGWDGLIGQDDIQHILTHPNQFPPDVVNAAKVIDQHFTTINKNGDGLIDQGELAAFQKNLAENTGSAEAVPVEPKIIEHFDFGDIVWRATQIANNEKDSSNAPRGLLDKILTQV